MPKPNAARHGLVGDPRARGGVGVDGEGKLRQEHPRSQARIGGNFLFGVDDK